MKKIAINGFGRIGRMVFKILNDRFSDQVKVVAINDLSDPQTLAHLLEFDSTYGRYKKNISASEGNIIIDGKKILCYAEKKPENLPWADLDIDLVLECTGIFRTKESLQKHREAGAKKVILSSPAKDSLDGVFVLGVNDELYDKEKHHIISNASCTTNCLAPVLKVLEDEFGVERGSMTTIHSYTGDQRLLDAPHSDLRRSRSAAESIIPTKTGAAKAIAKVIPSMEGKLQGIAIRVPTPTVSLLEIIVVLKNETTVDEIHKKLKQASDSKMKNILGLESRPLVSRDFVQDPRSSIVDTESTVMIGKNMAKIFTWYDNEWGYSNRLAEIAVRA